MTPRTFSTERVDESYARGWPTVLTDSLFSQVSCLDQLIIFLFAVVRRSDDVILSGKIQLQLEILSELINDSMKLAATGYPI